MTFQPNLIDDFHFTVDIFEDGLNFYDQSDLNSMIVWNKINLCWNLYLCVGPVDRYLALSLAN